MTTTFCLLLYNKVIKLHGSGKIANPTGSVKPTCSSGCLNARIFGDMKDMLHGIFTDAVRCVNAAAVTVNKRITCRRDRARATYY